MLGPWFRLRGRSLRGTHRVRRLMAEALEARWFLSAAGMVDERTLAPAVPGELLIGYQSGLSRGEIAELQAETDLLELQRFVSEAGDPLDPIGLVSWGLHADGADFARLARDPRVAFIEPNYIVRAATVPDDAEFDALWGLHNGGQGGGTEDADIDAVEAWDFNTGSTQTVVGVIDSGIDYTHPDLYLNIWLNQGEIPAFSGQSLVDVDGDSLITFYDLNASANSQFTRDGNGNGYIDGGDLLADARWADRVDGPDPGSFVDDLIGWDFANDDNDPFDDAGHGTHVSGTIGAKGDNGTGVTGVNWRTRLMPLKFLSADSSGTTANGISAIHYATMMDIKLTSNSWGSFGFSTALYNAIAASRDAGMLFVAAAGNDSLNTDSQPHYPSSYDLANIISVAATDQNDDLAWFTNYGLNSVDLAAPGADVLSTTPNTTYSSFSGTSMAAPYVTGVAALIWSAQPEATYQEVRDAIYNGLDILSGLGDRLLHGGRLNALNALQHVNPSRGTVVLDRDAYGLPDRVGITVVDPDLDRDPLSLDTVTVRVATGTEPEPELVVLTETGVSTQSFSGSAEIVAGPTAAGDVRLRAAHGDHVTVTYEDLHPGNGPALRTAAAVIDRVSPRLHQVVAAPSARRATISWLTDEPSDSVVRFGTDRQSLVRIAGSSSLTRTHDVDLFGLDTESRYYFEVTSADAAGNTTTPSGGEFVTRSGPPILLVDDDQGERLEVFFAGALDANNYDYAVWDVAAVGSSPNVVDLLDHTTVIWNTGADSEAPGAGLTADEEAGIRGFLDAGGNLFLSGQDVIYNGVSATFLSDYLHVAEFVQDERLDRAVGVSGDPIGDGLDIGVFAPPPFNLEFVDLLQPDSEAGASLFTSNAGSGPANVAVHYPRHGPSRFKTVFFSFPFESISPSGPSPNHQATVMDRVMRWFGNAAPGTQVAPNQVPVADAGGPYSIAAGGGLLLNASSSFDPDGGPSPLTFEWDLDYNGVFEVDARGRTVALGWSVLQERRIEPGSSYPVAVRVFDGLDATLAITQLTISQNLPPVAAAGGPYTIQPGWTVFLNSAGSYDPEAGPAPLTFEWDVGYDGDFTADLVGPATGVSWAALQQLGVEPGKSYPIAVRVFDGASSNIATTHLTVADNQPPVASVGGPYFIQPGWTLVLQAVGSFDPDFGPAPLTYQWDIDFSGQFVADVNGSFAALSWSALQQLGVEPGQACTIALRVSDGASVHVATTSLSVGGTAGLMLEHSWGADSQGRGTHQNRMANAAIQEQMRAAAAFVSDAVQPRVQAPAAVVQGIVAPQPLKPQVYSTLHLVHPRRASRSTVISEDRSGADDDRPWRSLFDELSWLRPTE